MKAPLLAVEWWNICGCFCFGPRTKQVLFDVSFGLYGFFVLFGHFRLHIVFFFLLLGYSCLYVYLDAFQLDVVVQMLLFR